MNSPTHSISHPSDGLSSSVTRSGASGGDLAGGWTAGGGPESGEAAGLVTFKTSPHGEQITFPDGTAGSLLSVSFDPASCRLKRLKRLKSRVWLSGNLHCLPRNGHRPDVPWFVTLTYRHEGEWRPQHIAESIDRYRAWCKRRGVNCRYVWVAELTAKGRVHYHLIAWLPVGQRMTFWDKPRRVKGRSLLPMWTHGATNTQKCTHGVSYLMKYLSKMGEFHEFPSGMRLHGCGGLDQDQRKTMSWHSLPGWVKREHGVGDVRRINGSLVIMSTGEILPPMYQRKLIPGGLILTQLRPMPEKVYDHGAWCSYSSQLS